MGSSSTISDLQPTKGSSRVTPGLIVSHVLSALLLALVVSSARSFRDSGEDAMAFYGVYHQTPGNQLVHFIGVPCLIFTLFLFQAHLKIYRRISWASVTALFYLLFYTKIDPIGAALYAPFLLLMHWAAHMLVDFDQNDYRMEADERFAKKTDEQVTNKASIIVPWTGTTRMLYYALGLQVIAWYVQIHPGHHVMEGARPALMTSLGDALTTAPLFSCYEGFWLLGIRKDFQKQVLKKVEERTRLLCLSGANMRVCKDYSSVDATREEDETTIKTPPYDSDIMTEAQREKIGEMMRQHEIEEADFEYMNDED